MTKNPEPEIVPFSRLAPYTSKAAKDRVSLKDSRNTVWFATFDLNGNLSACGGVYVMGHKARFKAIWTSPAFRSLGLGSALTDAMFRWAQDQINITLYEVYAYDAEFWQKRGFRLTGANSNGSKILHKAA